MAALVARMALKKAGPKLLKSAAKGGGGGGGSGAGAAAGVGAAAAAGMSMGASGPSGPLNVTFYGPNLGPSGGSMIPAAPVDQGGGGGILGALGGLGGKSKGGSKGGSKAPARKGRSKYMERHYYVPGTIQENGRSEGYKINIGKVFGSVTKAAGGLLKTATGLASGAMGGGGDAGGGDAGGGPGGPGGGPGGGGGPGLGGTVYTPMGVYPTAQTSPIHINVVVSGEGVSASQGGGPDDQIGIPQATNNTVDDDSGGGLLGGLLGGGGAKTSKGAPKGGAPKGAPKGASKGGAPRGGARRGRSKYTEFSEILQGTDVNVSLMTFSLVALLILLLN